MLPLIVQKLNGVPHGETYSSEANALDNGNSSIRGDSLFVRLDSEGLEVIKPKDTDDKILIGYTHKGAAFLLVVDGFFGGEREHIFAFIDEHVIPLLSDYSFNLSVGADDKKLSSSLIHTIYNLRAKHAPMAEFTMSLGVSYHKQKDLFYAGFGIGDTGMLIKRTNGKVEQLVSHTEVDGFKDAFDSYSQSNIDLVIARNSLFNTKVNPGDELVGYTYIQPELERLTAEFESERKGKKQLVRKFNLVTEHYSKPTPLFEQLLNTITDKQQQLIARAKKQKKEARFGDDFAIGQLIIPDKKLEQKLQLHALALAIKNGVATFIAQKKASKTLFSFFSNLESKINKATGFKNLLEKYQQHTVSSLIIIYTLLSDDIFNEMLKPILQEFNLPSKKIITNQIIEFLLDNGLNQEDINKLLPQLHEAVQNLNFHGCEALLNNDLTNDALKYK